jgi:lipoprotein NlpD
LNFGGSGIIRKLVIFILFAVVFWSCASSHGVYYRLKPGDTLFSISRKYGSSVDKIKETNNIGDETKLSVGAYIFIPDTKGPVPATETVSAPSQMKTEDQQASDTIAPDTAPAKGAPSKFIWPVKGVLTSPFGNRWGNMHEGIDIGAPEGTPVFASAAGKVIFSGERGTYGLIVIIEHPDDWYTIYAHNSKNLVRQGATVKQGDKIALVGKTGRATGTHLHFEIRQGVKPLDPQKYLPKAAP